MKSIAVCRNRQRRYHECECKRVCAQSCFTSTCTIYIHVLESKFLETWSKLVQTSRKKLNRSILGESLRTTESHCTKSLAGAFLRRPRLGGSASCSRSLQDQCTCGGTVDPCHQLPSVAISCHQQGLFGAFGAIFVR